jgi:FMN reductase
LRVLGLGGSMGRSAQSRVTLETTLKLAADAGAETALADVRELNLPIYDPDGHIEDFPDTLPWLLNEVRRADAIIICSPTYHGTVTGAIKNMLDFMQFLGADTPPYFTGKAIGLMAVGGLAAANTITTLDYSARSLNGNVAPTTIIIPNGSIDLVEKRFIDPALRGRIDSMLAHVLELARALAPLRGTNHVISDDPPLAPPAPTVVPDGQVPVAVPRDQDWRQVAQRTRAAFERIRASWLRWDPDRSATEQRSQTQRDNLSDSNR